MSYFSVMGDLERLSRFLAKLLRHDAKSRGLDVTPGKIYFAIDLKCGHV